MKLIKALVALVVLVVIVLIVGVVVAVSSINTIARKGIEQGGTYALGVPTTVGSARVGLFSGEFGLGELKIANPEGFAAPHFMTLGEGDIAIYLTSLRQDVIRVPSFTLDTIDVRLERKGRASNYGTILQNLERLSAGSGETKPAPASQDEGKKFVIDNLLIKDVTVTADLLGMEGPAGAVLGGATRVTVPIKEIKLSNVGQTGTGVKGTGVTISDLASIIVQAVLKATVEGGGGLIPADMLGDLQGQLANLGDLQGLGLSVLGDVQGAAQQLGEQATKAVGDAAKQAEEAAKKAAEDAGKAVDDAAKKAEESVKRGLDNLLGGGKKDEKKDAKPAEEKKDEKEEEKPQGGS